MSLASASETAAAEEVGIDEVAIIFSFLDPKDILRARVCTSWRAAAMKADVSSSLIVDSERSYNAMRIMSTAIPNLQRISLRLLKGRHSFSNGDEPDELLTAIFIDLGETQARYTADFITHDVNIISRFRRLRVLNITEQLNGRYPVLFDFPYLQELHIINCGFLKWDLGMLSGLPQLKVLECLGVNRHVTGNLDSLRVLRDTLEVVRVGHGCRNVGGNLMDLADFPQLRELDLFGTCVTGDIRDIRECDFPALKRLKLSDSVRGGLGYEFQSVAEVPGFMHVVHRLLQRTPTLFGEWGRDHTETFGWRLSRASPDWYEPGLEILGLVHPLYLKCVRAGSRIGWCWCTWNEKQSCEINWLDPEPISGSDDYDAYTRELQLVEQSVCRLFRGYDLSPPNVDEFLRFFEDY